MKSINRNNLEKHFDRRKFLKKGILSGVGASIFFGSNGSLFEGSLRGSYHLDAVEQNIDDSSSIEKLYNCSHEEKS